VICLKVGRWAILSVMLDFRTSDDDALLYDQIGKRLKSVRENDVSMCIDLSDADEDRIHKLMRFSTEGAPRE